jgi:hypothetical protein
MKEENANGCTHADDAPKEASVAAQSSQPNKAGILIILMALITSISMVVSLDAHEHAEITTTAYQDVLAKLELDNNGTVKNLVAQAMDDNVITWEEYHNLPDNRAPIKLDSDKPKFKDDIVKKLKE